MTDQRFDFGALDPARDPDFDARVSRIVAEGMAARRGQQARVTQAGVLDRLTRWTRPALAAAAVIVLFSLPALARLHHAAQPASPPATPRPIDQITNWAHTNHEPTPVELFSVLEASPPDTAP